MSQLEGVAKPILIKLIRGEAQRLPPEDQSILSRWVAKTVMVAEQLFPTDDGIEQAERSMLMTSLQPLNSWFVWIGAYRGEKWRDLASGQVRIALDPEPVSRPSEARYSAQAVTMGLGNVLICSINTNSSDAIKYYRRREDTRLVPGLMQISPDWDRTLLWPPAEILDDEHAHRVSNIFKHSEFLDPRTDPGAGWRFELP